jgi:hypothetical protein
MYFVFNVSLTYDMLYARHVKVFAMRELQRGKGTGLSEKNLLENISFT